MQCLTKDMFVAGPTKIRSSIYIIHVKLPVISCIQRYFLWMFFACTNNTVLEFVVRNYNYSSFVMFTDNSI